jgi:transposase
MDFESISSMSLYRVSDLLVKHQDMIEKTIFNRIKTLFSLSATVTLYDLTNTYFEGEMTGNDKARRGHSKEKRSDCPLVTLGLVLDDSGFVRRSRMFAGNAVESKTLEEMLQGLDAPSGALVVMDRGIATKDNIAWLVKHGYRYVVVSRERQRHFDPDKAVELITASNQTIRLQREINEDATEVRLYCHSQERQAKENAMTKQFAERFEQGLSKLVEGLSKPRSEKRYEKIQQRIGSLKAKSHGVSQHYQIDVATDADGKKVTGITWRQEPLTGSMWTHPGVYCLRSNEVDWNEETLWRTYIMLTDLEAVFRSMKSELGMHPIYHHKKERAQGHLFITVLAYQAVQMLRQKLAAKQIRSRWHILRETLSTQQRITVTFQQRNGRTLNVRKSTIAEPKLKQLYDALGIITTPGGIQKYVN